jgi:biotin transporter BioY
MRRAKDAGTLLAPVAVAAFAIVCCAGLPVLAGTIGGLTLAALLGAGAGLIACIVVVAGVILLLRERRRRRSCPPASRGPAS